CTFLPPRFRDSGSKHLGQPGIRIAGIYGLTSYPNYSGHLRLLTISNLSLVVPIMRRRSCEGLPQKTMSVTCVTVECSRRFWQVVDSTRKPQDALLNKLITPQRN